MRASSALIGHPDRPMLRELVFIPSSFDPHVGSDEAAAMTKIAHRCRSVGSAGFDEVFDDKSRLAQSAHELLPAMKMLCGVVLPIRSVFNGRKRPLVIIFHPNHIVMIAGAA